MQTLTKIRFVRITNLIRYGSVRIAWTRWLGLWRYHSRMKNKAKFTLYKPEKMSSNRFDRLCRKLVQILEKLEVDVHAKRKF